VSRVLAHRFGGQHCGRGAEAERDHEHDGDQIKQDLVARDSVAPDASG
jgi:hypothetical protein